MTDKNLTRERDRLSAPVGERTRTKQSFKDECDINKIVNRFRKTGQLTHVTGGEPIYGDFSKSVELQEAIERVEAAWTGFMNLDAHIRKAADNDPVKLLEMLADEDQAYALQEAGMELGLAPREVRGEEPAPAPQGETPTE